MSEDNCEESPKMETVTETTQTPSPEPETSTSGIPDESVELKPEMSPAEKRLFLLKQIGHQRRAMPNPKLQKLFEKRTLSFILGFGLLGAFIGYYVSTKTDS